MPNLLLKMQSVTYF